MTARRILHCHFGKEGGAERFFVNLAQAFAENRIEQRFVIRPGRSWRDDVAALGPVIEHPYRAISISSLALNRRIRRLAQEWRPDVIIGWMPRGARLVPDYAPAVKLARLGDYPRNLRHFGLLDCIVVNAPGIAERCRELGWKGELRIISNFPRPVAPVPIDRARLRTPQDAFVICGSGRFVGYKGFDTLIRVAAKIPDAWLWLVGDGEERARLEALVAAQGIAERTRFTGWVSEATHYMAASDVFVMPSRHEPLGNAILECWQTGVPLVSARSQGPAWMLNDGENALVCPIDDIEALAVAVLRLRHDAALRDALVRNGRARLTAKFSKSAILSEYFELFERTAAAARPARAARAA
jgi:glycosyltransferase involved in cell wall biosynthesis